MLAWAVWGCKKGFAWVVWGLINITRFGVKVRNGLLFYKTLSMHKRYKFVITYLHSDAQDVWKDWKYVPGFFHFKFEFSSVLK